MSPRNEIPENTSGLKIRDFPRTEKYGFRRFWAKFHVLREVPANVSGWHPGNLPGEGNAKLFLAQKSMVLNANKVVPFTRLQRVIFSANSLVQFISKVIR